MNDVITEERPRFASAVAAEVASASMRWSLPEEQKRKLTVAGNGATERCMRVWKSQTSERIKLVRAKRAQRVGLFTMAVPGPRVSSIHQDTLWLHTLETVKASVAARRPLRFRRKAITEYVTGMLDKELWLTTEQREPLRELVDSAFPQVIETQRPRLKEFELLAVPLFRIQDDQLATVLRESQVAAW